METPVFLFVDTEIGYMGSQFFDSFCAQHNNSTMTWHFSMR